MPIPGAINAYIPLEKLSEYLLNPRHPVGGSKARWLMARGYSPSQAHLLEADLLQLVRESEEFNVVSNDFGVKYIVKGKLAAPNGDSLSILSVWFTANGLDSPRLVTAYPDEEHEE